MQVILGKITRRGYQGKPELIGKKTLEARQVSIEVYGTNTIPALAVRRSCLSIMGSLEVFLNAHWDHESLRLTEALSRAQVCDPQQGRFMGQ